MRALVLVLALAVVLVCALPAFAQADEPGAISSLKAIMAAEAGYAKAYPEHGYACKLSELGPPTGNKVQGPEAASLLDPVIASGKDAGYKFELSCPTPSKPRIEYKVSATPLNDKAGRIFCGSQGGIVRTGPDAKTCLKNGTLVKESH